MRSDVNAARNRGRLMGAVVSMATFIVLCVVALPNMETSLVFIPILTLSALAGGLVWALVRYRARRSARTI
jgi:hypothetical protein